jgi:hypothetical protein
MSCPRCHSHRDLREEPSRIPAHFEENLDVARLCVNTKEAYFPVNRKCTVCNLEFNEDTVLSPLAITSRDGYAARQNSFSTGLSGPWFEQGSVHSLSALNWIGPKLDELITDTERGQFPCGDPVYQQPASGDMSIRRYAETLFYLH